MRPISACSQDRPFSRRGGAEEEIDEKDGMIWGSNWQAFLRTRDREIMFSYVPRWLDEDDADDDYSKQGGQRKRG